MGEMMDDPLATYLHDHLAGCAHAVDLLKAIRDQQTSKPLGHFADYLLREIEADGHTLRKLADSVGVGSSNLKEIGAWVEEKISRLKLRDLDRDSVGTFEALEFLRLGIHGKAVLWSVLAIIAATDRRLSRIDFRSLSGRAEAQEMAVEEWRLKVAETVFGTSSV